MKVCSSCAVCWRENSKTYKRNTRHKELKAAPQAVHLAAKDRVRCSSSLPMGFLQPQLFLCLLLEHTKAEVLPGILLPSPPPILLTRDAHPTCRHRCCWAIPPSNCFWKELGAPFRPCVYITIDQKLQELPVTYPSPRLPSHDQFQLTWEET